MAFNPLILCDLRSQKGAKVKMKKLMTVLLSAAMTTGMLAGCAGGKEQSTDEPTGETVSTEAAADSEGKVTVEFFNQKTEIELTTPADAGTVRLLSW